MKQFTKFKRLLSGLLSAVMALSAVPSASVNAAESNSAFFNYEGYAVSYVVTDSWDNTEIVSVTITNTSESPIENWMLYFDPHGSITNIWDAQTAVTSTNVTYFKNARYNSTIEPDASVTFSYFIDDCVSIPDSYTLCQQRVEKENNGYSVRIVVDDSWDDVFNGTIILTNEADNPIEDWELTFDTNFTITEITSSWAGTMTTLEPYCYMLKGSYTNIIEPHSSVNLGFSGIKNGTPEIIDSSLTEVVVNERLIEFANNYTDDISIYAYGEYNKEVNSIDIEWLTDYEGSTFTIWESDDNKVYELVDTVTDATMYQYIIADDFDTKYFKVSFTYKNGAVIESIPFRMFKTEDGYELELVDTDDDGVADIYEQLIGTDASNPDTDEDGLNDYQELYITGTDPTVYDSVTEGISDADADIDDDKLSNITEIELGTDPQLDDTDCDGLTDGEEVNIYFTDPLVPDTDGDGLDDGSEVKLGLDPLSPSTFGVPDSEYSVDQTVSADSDTLSAVNTEESPYDMSIKIKTNGYAEKELTVEESGYSVALKNDAQLGEIADLTISDFCNPESITLEYTIKDAYTDNTLNKYSHIEGMQGIERLCVFKYYESINMMLPLITEYDIEKNLVYAEVNELGTYCVMDLEIWFDMLRIDPTADQSKEMSTKEISNLYTPSSSTTATSESGKNGTPVLMFILLQGAGNDQVLYNNELTLIEDFCSNILSRYPNTTIGLIRSYYYRSPEFAPGVFNPSNGATIQLLDSSSLNSESHINLSSSTYYTFEEDELASTSPIYAMLNSWLTGDFADNYEYKFVYDFQNGNVQVDNDKNGLNICTEYPCIYSHISSDEYTYTSDIDDYSEKLHDAILDSDGLDLTYDSNTLSELIRHFDSFFPTVGYDAILSNNYKTVKLLTELSPENDTDTDKDELTDWEEMNQAYITVNSDGSVTLPRIRELIRMGEVDKDELILNLPPSNYLEKQKMFERIQIVRVLPCKSDPTSIDSDGDGFPDKYSASLKDECEYSYSDPRPLFSDVTIHKLKENDYLQMLYNGDTNYGSNQDWFLDLNTKFSNGKIDNSFAKKHGCGLVATGDLIAYLHLFSDLNVSSYIYNKVLKLSSPAGDSIFYNPLGDNNFNKLIDGGVYIKYLNMLSDITVIHEFPQVAAGTWPISFMNLGGSMQDTLNDMFDYCGLNYEASWQWNNDNTNLKSKISNMLDRNIPVITSYDSTIQGSKLKFYKRQSDGTYIYNQDIGSHYFNITAMIEYSTDVMPYTNHRTMMKISTWGQEQYFDFEEYISKVSSVPLGEILKLLIRESSLNNGLYGSFLANEIETSTEIARFAAGFLSSIMYVGEK